MADNFMTLTDLLRINDRNLTEAEATSLRRDSFMAQVLAADIASQDTSHKYLRETGAPTVGFRTVNAGREYDKSVDEAVTIQLKILSANVKADKALADSWRGGPEAFMEREAMRHLAAAIFAAGTQYINGTGNEADGFNGLADELDDLSNEMVIDAGGSGSALSSAWLIRSTGDLRDVVAVVGRAGNIEVGETTVIEAEDGDGKNYPAYYVPVEGWLGLQIGGAYSVARIANIGTTTGTNTLDDDMLYDAMSRFRAAAPPTAILVSRRSMRQLRQSRTATNALGSPAPFPADIDGVPIYMTDEITDTESAVAAES